MKPCLLCPKPARSRGYCVAHYRRLWRHGSPTAGGPFHGSLADRFWPRVDKQAEGCWAWTGPRDKRGYGRLRGRLAHRIAYELAVGPIPLGLTLDHLCRTHHCVRPTHLEPVTVRVNTLRGEGRAAKEARQTHCVRGHPFDLFNTDYRKRADGSVHRDCIACRRMRGSKSWPKGRP